LRAKCKAKGSSLQRSRESRRAWLSTPHSHFDLHEACDAPDGRDGALCGALGIAGGGPAAVRLPRASLMNPSTRCRYLSSANLWQRKGGGDNVSIVLNTCTLALEQQQASDRVMRGSESGVERKVEPERGAFKSRRGAQVLAITCLMRSWLAPGRQLQESSNTECDGSSWC
jgi:hypothetical protein